MSCYICYNEGTIRCQDECQSVICRGCLTSYIEFSCRNNSIIMCECGSNYKYGDIQGDTYNKWCRVRATTNFDILDDGAKVLLDLFRKERDMYLKTLPKGISFVIRVAMGSKMKMLEHLQKKVPIKTERCFSLFCTGRILPTGECNQCSKVWCLLCERPMDDQDHKCKQEDVDTVTATKDLVRCPECNVPIYRIGGCNMVTCHCCQTNFDYTTGERTFSGNHETIHINLKTRLSEKVGDDLKDYIFQMEQEMPILKKLNPSILELDDTRLARTMTKWYRSKILFQRYITKMRKLETLFERGELTTNILKEESKY